MGGLCRGDEATDRFERPLRPSQGIGLAVQPVEELSELLKDLGILHSGQGEHGGTAHESARVVELVGDTGELRLVFLEPLLYVAHVGTRAICPVNQPLAKAATASRAPGSSKRWVAPGTTSRRFSHRS